MKPRFKLICAALLLALNMPAIAGMSGGPGAATPQQRTDAQVLMAQLLPTPIVSTPHG